MNDGGVLTISFVSFGVLLRSCLGLINFLLLAALLFKQKGGFKKPFSLIRIGITAFIFTLFTEYLFNRTSLNMYQVIMLLLISWIYIEVVMAQFAGKRSYKLATGGCYLLFCFYADSFLSLLILSIFGESFRHQFMGRGWIVDDLLEIALLLLLLYVNKQRTKKEYDYPIHLIVLSVFITANCVVIALLFLINGELIILLPIVFLLLLFFNYLKLSKQAFKENYHYQVKEQKQQLLKEHYKKIDGFHQEIQQLQHKMNIQLMTMQKQVERNEFPQMAMQLAGMIEENISVDYQWFTSHKEMNVLVGHKYRQAQAAGILFKGQINIPRSLTISEIDLISLVSNLLDNAIEACSYCSSGEAWINFQMAAQKQCLVIRMENSTDNTHQSFTTRKPDKQQHGIGLKSVQRIVKKYNGELDFEWQERSFSIEITLFTLDYNKVDYLKKGETI